MSGQEFFQAIPGPYAGLLRISLQAAVVAGLIVIAHRLAGRRLTPRWRYALWWVFVARLMLPWTPESGWSVFNLYYMPERIVMAAEWGDGANRAGVGAEGSFGLNGIDGRAAVESPALGGAKAEELGGTRGIAVVAATAGAANAMGTGTSAIGDTPAPGVTRLAGYAPFLWFAGFLLLLGRMVVESWRFSWRVVRRRPLTDQRVLDALEDCKEAMGVRTYLAVVETPRVDSPSLFGVLRPRLLLPEGLAASLSNEQLRHVFFHELAHLKRRDVAVNWLMAVLQAWHWFNPAIWLAFSRMRADRELACDALAMSYLDGGRARDYGQTLVDLMERSTVAPARPAALAALVGVVERNARIKERIGWIARNEGRAYRRGGLVGKLAILALGFVSLSDARPPELDWNQTVRVPAKNSLALPAVPEGSASTPIPSGRVMAHVFLMKDDVPIAFQEFEFRWPEDKSRNLSFRHGKVDVRLCMTNMASSSEEPADPYLEVRVRPYLLLECDGRMESKGFFGGASAGFGGAYYGSQCNIRSAMGDGFTAAVVLSPFAPDDPTKEISLREFVKARWSEIGGQAGYPTKHRVWSEAIGFDLPAVTLWKERAALHARLMARAGGREGGSLDAEHGKVCLVDFDTTRTLTLDKAPSVWPGGFDALVDPVANQWTARPQSTVRICSYPAVGNTLDDLRTAHGRMEVLDSSTASTAQGTPMIRTDQGQTVIILKQSGFMISGPPFGKRTKTAILRWQFLTPPEPQTAPASSHSTSPVPSDSSSSTANDASSLASKEKDFSSADWRARFDAVYSLKEGEVLKRIAPPFIPEREQYYRNEHRNQALSLPEPPDHWFTFLWKDGTWKYGGLVVGSPPYTLREVLLCNIDLGRYEFECPDDLLSTEVSGDWIRRDGASREELLQALETILHDELRRDIRFERRSVEREAVVVTGTYSFTPQPEAYSPHSVHIYTDTLDPNEGAGGGNGTISEFLTWVSDRTGILFVDGTVSSGVSMEWENHESSGAVALREDPKRLDLLLTNLERQTGLKYRRERRMVDIWFVSEEKPGQP